MKIRLGRHQSRNLYVQLGSAPSDDDEYIGVIFEPSRAEYIAGILNGDIPPLNQDEAGR